MIGIHRIHWNKIKQWQASNRSCSLNTSLERGVTSLAKLSVSSCTGPWTWYANQISTIVICSSTLCPWILCEVDYYFCLLDLGQVTWYPLTLSLLIPSIQSSITLPNTTQTRSHPIRTKDDRTTPIEIHSILIPSLWHTRDHHTNLIPTKVIVILHRQSLTPSIPAFLPLSSLVLMSQSSRTC